MAENPPANNDLFRQPSLNAPISAKAPFALAPRQQRVYDALIKRTRECADMYFGAARVLTDLENPERLSQAAHSLRELMEKIGPSLGVAISDRQVQKGDGNLNDKFGEIESLLLKAEKYNFKDGAWSGEIHTSTAKLLSRAQAVRVWREANKKLRKTDSEALISTFDPLLAALPEEIQETRIAEWDKTHNFFIGICHHRKNKIDEFDKWLFLLESHLLAGLLPQMTENLSAIDSIIKAGEKK